MITFDNYDAIVKCLTKIISVISSHNYQPKYFLHNLVL